jgi:hypothetical protein
MNHPFWFPILLFFSSYTYLIAAQEETPRNFSLRRRPGKPVNRHTMKIP